MTHYNNITSSYYSIDTRNRYSVWENEEDKKEVYREMIKSELLGEAVVKVETISPSCSSCRFRFLCCSLGLSSYVKKDVGDCSGYRFLAPKAYRGIDKSEDEKLKIELDEIRGQGYETDEENTLIKLTITSWLKERGF